MNEIFLKNYVRINEDKGFFGIEGGFGEEKKSMLASDIALMHNKETKRINEAIRNNIDKFVEGKDFIDVKNNSNFLEKIIDYKILNINSLNRSSNVFILSETGYFKLLELMKDRNIENDYILEKYFKSDKYLISSVSRKEIKFKKLLLEMFENIYEIKTQYKILGYKVDFYILELNLVIEFDEERHKYSKEKDDKRQEEIKKEINCEFIRISEFDSNAKVFNKVLRFINKSC